MCISWNNKKCFYYILCVRLAFVIQHAMRMRRIILSPVACLVLPYFSKLSHKRYDFRGEKKVIEHECVLIFSNLCLKHFSFKKNSERYYHKCIQSSGTAPVRIVSLKKPEVPRQIFRNILRYQISQKSVQWVPSCSMWTDRHDEANSRFSQFCEQA